MDYAVQALTQADEPLIWLALMHAAHEPTIAAVQQQPCLVIYGQDWGRAGDMGCGAYQGEVLLGAVWLRLWVGNERGFGYMGEGIPELAIGVLPQYRGQGIGTTLLMHMIAAARTTFPGVCLNVRADNPAVRLYQRLGFVEVEGSEVKNRAGGISFNMVCWF